MNKMKLTVIICILLFGLQIVLPIQNAVQAKQNSQHFVNNAYWTNVGTDTSAFLSTWNTSAVSQFSTNASQIKLPLTYDGIFNFIVQWGDGSQSNITNYSEADVTHTYTNPGVYNVNITGLLNGWRFAGMSDELKLLGIAQWGSMQLGNDSFYFEGAANLVITAKDTLNLTGTTNLRSAFAFCENLGSSGNFNNWDVSHVTTMTSMFGGALSFNQPLNNWNVSQVTTMDFMFSGARSFDQSIGNWDVSHVTTMQFMFDNTSFNQPLDSWNTTSVTNMGEMFEYASAFNQPLNAWNTAKVTGMALMFKQASAFNQPLDAWNTTSVTRMEEMFEYASAFNQPLDAWNTASVTNMESMFYNATVFDQNLGTWNVSNIQFPVNMVDMLKNSNLSTPNYSSLLIGWSKLHLQHGILFDAGMAQYNSTALTARQYIINTFGWQITDGGLSSAPQTQPTTSYSSPSTSSSPTTISPNKSSPVSLVGVILGLAIITRLRTTKHRRKLQ